MRRKQKREQVLDPVAELERRVSQHKSALFESSFYVTLRSALHEAKTKLVREIKVAENCMHWQSVCLGLGSLSDNRVSRIQFCILECLIELTGAARDKCVMYDPQFNETDKQYLRNAGYRLIEQNEEGRHRVDLKQADEFLLLYLPHCGTALYQNFFAENWDSTVDCSTNQNPTLDQVMQDNTITTEANLCTCTPSKLTLNRTLFIGNQLTAIRDRSLDRLWLSRFPHLAYLAEHGAFECTLDYADEPHAHSDTALQLFSVEPDAEFTRLRSVRPAYDAEAVDIVLNSSSGADKHNV